MGTRVILLISLMVSCTKTNDVLVLDYNDFGPQAMAYETIGYSWYEWDSHGGEEENHNVKVVIYEGTLEDVKELYKDDKSRPVDYRFINKKDAIKYFQTKIAELKILKNNDKVSFPGILKTLESSLKKISGKNK